MDNAPNVLNAVCQAYPAEYPTPIPPIIPMYGYIDVGRNVYNPINNKHPTILNKPLFPALSVQSFAKGRQTDIQEIPAHIALGKFKRDIINIALDTINVNLIYHLFRKEVISNSRNKSKKLRRYGLFFCLQ